LPLKQRPPEELNLHEEDKLSPKMPRESKDEAQNGGKASTEKHDHNGKASARVEEHPPSLKYTQVAKHLPNNTTTYDGKACAREEARQQCIR